MVSGSLGQRLFAEDWGSSDLLPVTSPSNALCIVLPGKEPGGEEGTSVEEVPKDGVSVKLHDAKMSRSVLFTF